jgi:hypothetical protein
MCGNVVVAVVASSVTQNETSDGGWSFLKGMGDGRNGRWKGREEGRVFVKSWKGWLGRDGLIVDEL